MAILHGGLFGPITGKISGMIVSSWKGINYVREAPPKSNKPRTDAQIAVQEKFKFVHTLIKPLSPYFTAGFQHQAIHKSEYNVGYSRIYKNAISGVFPDIVVDYSKITISEGSLLPLEFVETSQTISQVLDIAWEVESFKSRCEYDDQLMIAILCNELGLVDGFIGGTDRADLQRSFKFNSKFIGKEISVYVGLYSLNQRNTSHSQFLGQFVAI